MGHGGEFWKKTWSTGEGNGKPLQYSWHWIIKKAREFQKNIYCFVEYKALTVWITINWKILQKMGKPNHLTCPLRYLYVGQEATARTRHGKTNWFQIGKGVPQGCILSPCLFNLYAEYIIRNAGLSEAHAGIKIVGRNSNNLRHTTFNLQIAITSHSLPLWQKVKEN